MSTAILSDAQAHLANREMNFASLEANPTESKTASAVAQGSASTENPEQAQTPSPAGTPAANQPSADEEAKAEELRKAAQNPVASLISVPVQDNINPGFEPGYRTQNVLNIQPVIPVKLNEDWNMIIRWITPIIYQPITPPSPGAPELGASGLGDMQPTFLFSPRKPHKITWGAGPIFQLPTATSRYLGQGKFGIGPNLVVLAMPRHFVMGVLVNNIWSVAGSGGRTDVNQMLLQYFVNYNMKKVGT